MATDFRNILGTLVDLHSVMAIGPIRCRLALGNNEVVDWYYRLHLKYGVEITVYDPDEDAAKTSFATLSTLLIQLT